MENGQARAMQEALLRWYEENRRELPWREDPTPYHVWLSEIMLQQTRVEAVKAYYRRFLAAFPDIVSLAGASEDEYLKLWEGLGYYRRVRNLHKAAGIVTERYGGRLPASYAELRALPGIGAYTAAAIASIAFGIPQPAVDGNLLRVFARVICHEEAIETSASGKAAETWFRERMPDDAPGDFNQALMDLGATVCLPNGAPRCTVCPWQTSCLSYRNGIAERYPLRAEKKPRKREARTVFLLTQGDAIYLRRRPQKGLLAGMWEFPNTEGHLSPAEAKAFLAKQGMEVGEPEALPSAVHTFTHCVWEMTAYRVEVKERERTAGSEELVSAARAELEASYAIPSAFAAYRALL